MIAMVHLQINPFENFDLLSFIKSSFLLFVILKCVQMLVIYLRQMVAKQSMMHAQVLQASQVVANSDDKQQVSENPSYIQVMGQQIKKVENSRNGIPDKTLIDVKQIQNIQQTKQTEQSIIETENISTDFKNQDGDLQNCTNINRNVHKCRHMQKRQLGQYIIIDQNIDNIKLSENSQQLGQQNRNIKQNKQVQVDRKINNREIQGKYKVENKNRSKLHLKNIQEGIGSLANEVLNQKQDQSQSQDQQNQELKVQEVQCF